MQWNDEKIILANPDILSENHLPPEIHARDTQMKEIAFCLRPIVDHRKPVNCWLHGKPGVGKTATSRWTLRKLENEASVRGVYVNCWEHPTAFSALECISREMRVLGAEKLSTSFKLERLKRQFSNERLVIVLDEIDQPAPSERNAILYNLSELPTVGLICACNSQYVYFGLEERIKSRLNPSRIYFGEYSQNELLSILEQRAQFALVPGTCSEYLLRTIAGLAAGDARIAIQTLKNAAFMAEKEDLGEIRASHVKRAWNSAKDLKKTYLLRKLTDHHRLLFELVVKQKKVLSGDLWRVYLKTCNTRKTKPIAVRTYSEYCNKLVELGLIQTKRAAIQGKVREFSVVQ
ncbi:Cdc6/Cdc18 family protein [Candidatus Latescibacterota bacterium]